MKAFQDEFKKARTFAKRDTEIQTEATSLAAKLAEDPTLKTAEVGTHKDITAHLTQKNVRICWGCLSANCLIR